MNKRRNNKNIFFTLLISFLILIIGITLFAGNYLVNYAIYTGSEKNSHKTENNVSPEFSTKNEAQLEVYDEWVQTVNTEEITIKTNDGLTLWGLQYNSNPDSNKWAILVHGYTSSHDAMRYHALKFSEESYNVITPDNRAHGNSEGDYIGMGWLDHYDIMNWIHYVIENNQDAEIVLLGESMGGAAVTMLSGEELPSNVKAIIEDCGYTSVFDIFAKELKSQFGLPSFPFMQASSLITRIRAGYDFYESSAVNMIRNAKVPMLFIHGSDDDFVPPEMMYELYEACPTSKDYLVVEGAAHAESSVIDENLYFNKIFEFLKENINN